MVPLLIMAGLLLLAPVDAALAATPELAAESPAPAEATAKAEGSAAAGETSLDPALLVKTEDLGAPVRTMRRGGDFFIPKPGDKGWWFVTSYNPMYRSAISNQIFVVDLDAKTYRVVWGPAGGGLSYGWNNQGVTAPDGTRYICQYGKMGLFAFNPKDSAMEWIDYPEITDRVSPFQISLTPDGKIFMGTASARAYLVSFDLKTRKFRNYGIPGPGRSRPMYIWSMAVADDYVYSGMGKNPWTLVATHRETGEHKVLLADMTMKYLDVNGSGDACRASIQYVPDPQKKDTTAKSFILKGGQAIEFDPAKEPKPAEKAKPAPLPELVDTLTRPTSEGKAQIWFRLPGKEWDHVALEGVQTTPWKSVFLRALPDGRLIGAPEGYEDIFTYDPKADKIAILGKASMSMGTIECLGGKVFFCGYPGTIVHEYDPKKPWTFFTSTPTHKEPELAAPESNPRFCARLGDIAQTHHVHGTAIGADGLIYVGGHAERLHVGGGLMWWDPVNRKAGGLREPFLVQDCADIAAARGGKLIVYSSYPVSDPQGKIPSPKEAKLFVYDIAAGKIVSEMAPLPGMASCGRIIAVGDKLFGIGSIAKQWTFYVVDLAANKTLRSAGVAGKPGKPILGPDGKIYVFLGAALTRIDPASSAMESLGLIEHPGAMEFVGNDLYLSGEQLRRIRNATSLKPVAAAVK